MGVTHSERFGSSIALSIPHNQVATLQNAQLLQGLKTRFYLAAGRREMPFLRATREFARLSRDAGTTHQFVEKMIHTIEFWEAELPMAMAWVLILQVR